MSEALGLAIDYPPDWHAAYGPLITAESSVFAVSTIPIAAGSPEDCPGIPGNHLGDLGPSDASVYVAVVPDSTGPSVELPIRDLPDPNPEDVLACPPIEGRGLALIQIPSARVLQINVVIVITLGPDVSEVTRAEVLGIVNSLRAAGPTAIDPLDATTTMPDDDSPGFSFTLPDDWHLAPEPLIVGAPSDYQLLAVATFPLRPGDDCVSPTNALIDAGPTDVFVFVSTVLAGSIDLPEARPVLAFELAPLAGPTADCLPPAELAEIRQALLTVDLGDGRLASIAVVAGIDAPPESIEAAITLVNSLAPGKP